MTGASMARRFRSTVAVGSAGAAIIAVAGLLGYVPGLRVLGSIRSDYVPMAPSTAGCLLTLSAILYFNARRPWHGAGLRAMVALALLVTTFGLLTVAGQPAGMDLTFEARFTRGFGTVGSIPIGRMSLMTGTVFVITGVGTVLLLLRAGSPRHVQRLGHWVSSLGVLTVLVAATVLLAYRYGVPLLYGGTAVPMAATTSVAFVCLGAALIAAAGPMSFPVRLFIGDSTAAGLSRAFVPLTVAAVFLHDTLSWMEGRWMWGNGALLTAILAVVTGALTVYAVTHVSHLTGSALDRSSRLLQESEARNRAITQSANDAIITTDRAGNILDWNRGADVMFGYTESEIIGQSVAVLMPKEFRAGHSSGMRRVTSGGAPHSVGQTVELMGTRKNGVVFPLELSLAAWTSSDEQFFTGMIRDITERKRAADEQTALQEQLANMRRMESVGLLAGGVAHEFNNNNAAVLGYAELTMRTLGTGHIAYPYVESIVASARHSADLTSQLLAFARTQAIVLKVLDLNETVAGMRERLPPLLGEHVQVEWTPGRALWHTAADAAHIEWVLTSLALNARDAMDGHDGRLQVSTTNIVLDAAFVASHPGARVGEFVHLRVSDNGSGMDAQTLSRVFEPFFTTKAPGKGTGLGLSAVHGIIEQHRGLVDVESTPGTGTTIHIYFPRASTLAEAEDGVRTAT